MLLFVESWVLTRVLIVVVGSLRRLKLWLVYPTIGYIEFFLGFIFEMGDISNLTKIPHLGCFH
jgi:hypothetical protein